MSSETHRPGHGPEVAREKLRAGQRFARRFLGDFKQFALRGNVLDLAVGVIIGTAFGAIMNSLVNDIFMPLLSLLTGGLDIVAGLALPLGTGEDAAMLRYGAFLSAVLYFVLVAFCLFLVVRAMARLRRPQPAPPPRLCPYCRTAVDKEAVRCPACTSHLEE